MTNDDLRKRLAKSNPTPPTEPVDPITSDRARALMEDIMTTETSAPRVDQRRVRMIGAVAAALVVVIGGAAILGGGNSTDPASNPPLVLTANGGDAMASCLPFDVEILKEMSPAFGGKVIGLTDSVATIEVDRWFTGGDAAVVEIQYTPGFEALIGTPSLEVGQRYLITATDGVVNGCGYSGIATADYEASFVEAFGA